MVPRIDRSASFLRFLYPFAFEARRYPDILKQVDESREWEPSPEDSPNLHDLLLPSISRLLRPPEGELPTLRRWQLKHNIRQCRDDPGLGFADSIRWELQIRRGGEDRRIPFRVPGIHLALFQVGLGFLILEANPTSQDPQDWLDFLHFFRFFEGGRAGSLFATRRPEKGREEPYRIPWAGQSSATDVPFLPLIQERLLQPLLPHSSVLFIPGRLIPFAALYVDNIPENEIPDLAYRLRNFFHAGQPVHLAPVDQDLDHHPRALTFTRHQWFLFSQEGGAFLSCNAPAEEFFRRTLPDHLRKHYFFHFLLTFHQSLALRKFSEEATLRWAQTSLKERSRAFEEIRRRFLEFTARGYFRQITWSEHHHRYYRRWQEVLEIPELFREIRREITEMGDYLLLRRTRRIETLATLLTTLLGLPTLTLVFLSVNLRGITASEGLSLPVALGFLGASFLVGGLLLLFARRS